MAARNRRRSVTEAEAEVEEAMERSSSDDEEEESTDLSEESSDTESEGEKNNGPPSKKQLTSLPHYSTSEIVVHSNPICSLAPEINPVSLLTWKKPKSKSATTVDPSKSPSDDTKWAKKKKGQNVDDEGVEYENLNSETKRKLFQRLWSEDDEVTILKGLIEYAETQGIDPASGDMSYFYEFIRNSLHIEASRSQLKEKIKRLKKKYLSKLKKSNNGYDRIFSKAHDQTCYNLSKKIWGTESKGRSYSTRPNTKDMDHDQAAAAAPANRQTVDSSLEKKMLKYWSGLITGEKKIELDNKMKHIEVKEMEVYLQRLDCTREKTALVLEALKSSLK
ncbi:probable transcription factor At2g01370 [Impatiens glandulifera]|uniref:probable transcription factor At2g01370 n=1 Tax=Impatiens glandulifera TaxID=253017 RepID=UPI001FB0787B|nr:probable transcription factor At2g01370 [Impatiens glandulifera]